MEIRKANLEDIEDILQIINEASEYIKSYNSDQWQNGTQPSKEIIEDDIKKQTAYILEQDKNKIGYFNISLEEEPSYTKIKNGKWDSNFKYATLHRVALKKEYLKKNLSKIIFDFIENKLINEDIRSLRLDTHALNEPMIAIMKKRHYKKCGIVIIENGEERIAYEKLLIPFKIGDKVQLKKTHPCGNNIFIIKRLGMDFRLECENCKSQIWLSRSDMDKRVKKRL